MKDYETKVVRRVIADMLAAGYSLGVDDGEEPVITRSRDADAVFAQMGTVDEEHLIVFDDTHTDRIGWVFFVYGNEPGVVINDYTTNLEKHMKGANDLSDTLS